MGSDGAGGRERLLEAAAAIARQLCDAAIFDETGRYANWLGRQDIVDDPLIARYSVRSAALGPEVYGGTAGVALFLTCLHEATGEPRFAATAAAALRRSVRFLKTTTLPLHPFSFFAGHAGVLAVVRRLAAAAPEQDVAAEAAWLGETIAAADPPEATDIIAGAAGGVLALLDCARGEDGAVLRDQARRCGDLLCDTALWEDGSCAWRIDPAGDGKVSPPMTGLAHGAAGMALALLGLYRETGTARYLETARGALAFTDALYSPEQGAWIDTRFPHNSDDGPLQGRFQSGWCHGGAGIILVRRLAAEIDAEQADVHLGYARAGVGAAARAMAEMLPRHHQDASLCHGLLGHGEALHDFARAVGDRALEAECLAAAATLAARHHALSAWPSGINAGGPNPSLMVGSAGIGYHLLRLARPGLAPPILTLFLD
jgi:lantibiotic modifying enzyme